MDVVVVESPAKAKTINKYLGSGYKVLASYGHVRDLPPKDGSVRPDEGFAMDWSTAERGEQLLGEGALELGLRDGTHVVGDLGAAQKPERLAEPFERGYGVTIGNSLRRVLLSSLEGAAATSIKIATPPLSSRAWPHTKSPSTTGAFRARAAELGARLDGTWVQHMVSGSAELLVTALRDREFGVMVGCGVGGGMTEIVDDVVFTPKPAQNPIPIWVGGESAPALRRTAS